MFKDRKEAGKKLAEELLHYKESDGVILAVPRGGVMVASPIAEQIELPIDIIISRKIGSPTNPEIAVGAVAEDGTILLNKRTLSYLDYTDKELTENVEVAKEEIIRRQKFYRGHTKAMDLAGKVVII